MKRATAIISGRVQGVGYRNIVDEVAFNYDITGYVKNLKDRTVEIVAEGEESALNAFFNEINLNEKPVFVKNISITRDEPTNEFTYFDIIRGDPAEEMGERMDIANIKLTNIDTKQDLTIGLQKETLSLQKETLSLQKETIGLQKETISEIKGLRSDTKSYLDQRFFEIQNELVDIKSALVKAGIKI